MKTGKLNKSITDIGGGKFWISGTLRFVRTLKRVTVHPSRALWSRKWQRSFTGFTVKNLKEYGVKNVEKGVFGADMQVSLINDGPVTVSLDTDIWRKNGN